MGRLRDGRAVSLRDGRAFSLLDEELSAEEEDSGEIQYQVINKGH